MGGSTEEERVIMQSLQKIKCISESTFACVYECVWAL